MVIHDIGYIKLLAFYFYQNITRYTVICGKVLQNIKIKSHFNYRNGIPDIHRTSHVMENVIFFAFLKIDCFVFADQSILEENMINRNNNYTEILVFQLILRAIEKLWKLKL